MLSVNIEEPSPASPTSSTSSRHNKKFELLSLAPPALAMGEDLEVGNPGDDVSVRDVWAAVTKASDFVKDGERLENLLWRWNWGQRNRDRDRRDSLSTASTHSSLDTPSQEEHITFPTSARNFNAGRKFGGALHMLLEEDNFKDWVSDAKRNLPVPTISVPDTPVANVEIRLVEPTPVPSRVGSLGGSIGAVGLLSSVASRSPARLREEPEAEETVGDEEGEADEGDDGSHGLMIRTSRAPSATPAGRSPRKRGGKFFVHSSPSKGSASDSSAVSPTNLTQPTVPSVPDDSPKASTSAIAQPQRKSSGSSTGLQIARSPKKGKSRSRHSLSPEKPKALEGLPAQAPPQPPQRRHVSLSTMRGKFAAEKRKAAEAIAAKAAEAQEAAAAAQEDDAAAEESGWEDEDEEAEEDWSDDDEEDAVEDEAEEARPGPSTTARRRSSRPSLPHRNSSDRAKSGRSSDNIDLSDLLQRPLGARKSRAIPPPPAPTPLNRMSKKERAAAAAERAKIEAELEAQRQREMFAKQQIFGTRAPGGGLLSGLLKSTGSMVNLTEARETRDQPMLRTCPTHTHIPALAKSPAPAPSLLQRSKSAVAMPVQSGVSVTARISPRRSKLSEQVSSPGSMEVQSPEDDRRRRSSVCSKASKESKGSKSSKRSETRGPNGVIMESSSEDSDGDDDYLATSRTNRKIAELAAKRDAKKQKQAAAQVNGGAGGSPRAGESSHSASHLPVPAGQPSSDHSMPIAVSPSTQRRRIIMREMSESLRRNLILEREKSSAMHGQRSNSFGHARPPPSTHTSVLPTRGSSSNLVAHRQPTPQPDQQQGGGPHLPRNKSQPALRPAGFDGSFEQHVAASSRRPANGTESPEPTHRAHRSMDHLPQAAPAQGSSAAGLQPQPEVTTRRRQPSVLGNGWLRPLTRVGGEMAPINRTQSSSHLTRSPGEGVVSHDEAGQHTSGGLSRVNSSSAVSASASYEAPAMLRRSTEGDPRNALAGQAHLPRPNGNGHIDPGLLSIKQREAWDRAERRRQLAERNQVLDTSYRTHGW